MTSYLASAERQFRYYKSLADKAMAQVADDALFHQPQAESNSIAVIAKHMWGNMLSRWTDFLHSDGEKPWRQRDAEFENDWADRPTLLAHWEEGWNYLFAALDGLTENDLEQIIYIRNEGHTVMEAINRQLCHYAYHVGQIVYIAKLAAGDDWATLSIARNKSGYFNQEKFAQERERRHFTEER
jgi:hypothetical protein